MSYQHNTLYQLKFRLVENKSITVQIKGRHCDIKLVNNVQHPASTFPVFSPFVENTRQFV
jgi:hypothetical protein